MHAIYRDAPSSGKRTMAERLLHYNGDKWGACAASPCRVGGRSWRAQSYREITAYARSRGCISIYLARASGFSVHVHRASTNTSDYKRVVLGLFCCMPFVPLSSSPTRLADSLSLSLSLLPLTHAPLVSREHDNNTIWGYGPQNIT